MTDVLEANPALTERLCVAYMDRNPARFEGYIRGVPEDVEFVRIYQPLISGLFQTRRFRYLCLGERNPTPAESAAQAMPVIILILRWFGFLRAS